MKKITVVFSLTIILLLAMSPDTALAFFSPTLAQEQLTDSSSVVALPFSDISGHWAEAAIMEMNFRGIMNGYGNSTFKPNNPVTQMEALVMLVRMRGFNPEDRAGRENYLLKEIFMVPDWAIPYVDYALENEITFYNELDKMTLQQPLIRQDAAVLVVRTLGLTRKAEKNNSSLSFKDSDKISAGAQGYVAIATEEGIMSGNAKGDFLPTNPISRGEIAAVFTRALAKLEKQNDFTETSGTVISVNSENPDKVSLIVESEDKEENEFILPEKSIIYKENKRVTTKQIIAGDKITILNKSINNENYSLVLILPQEKPVAVPFEKVNLNTAPQQLQILIDELKQTQGFHAYAHEGSLYLLVCRGEKPNSGYTIEIKEIAASTEKGSITAAYATSDPSQGMFYLPYINYPYSLVKVKVETMPETVIFQGPSSETEVTVTPL